MKIVRISTFDDIAGAGAAITAHPLHRGLLELGENSTMLVEQHTRQDPPRTRFFTRIGCYLLQDKSRGVIRPICSIAQRTRKSLLVTGLGKLYEALTDPQVRAAAPRAVPLPDTVHSLVPALSV